MEQELPSKKDVCLALLEQSVVRVFLDPRREGVTIPVWLRKQPQLLLDVGLNMPIPIPDLHVGEDALTCTLSFNRAPFFCIVPWTSVFALVGDADRGMIWPDDVPAELQIHAAQAPVKQERPRPVLTAVQNLPDEPSEAAAPAGPTEALAKNEKPGKLKTDKPAKLKAEKTPKKTDKSDKADLKKRPALQAAPSEAMPKATSALKADKAARKPDAEQGPKEDVKPTKMPAAAAASVNPKEGALKKKRELPPYLRVIK